MFRTILPFLFLASASLALAQPTLSPADRAALWKPSPPATQFLIFLELTMR